MGALLRDRRRALGLSQEALGEASGVSARSINRWEQGRALPQPEARRRLAEVLGIDVARLTGAARYGDADESLASPTVWQVPVLRNSFFTGREALLQELRVALSPDGSVPRVHALTGLAGVGK